MDLILSFPLASTANPTFFSTFSTDSRDERDTSYRNKDLHH